MLSERRWLKIYDFLTIRPKEVLENKRSVFECKDAKSEAGHSLLVRVDATHAGIVTGNRKFYRPDCMQDAAQTWVPRNGLAARPVLRGHDEDGDVLGRVRESKFIDDSWMYAKDFPILKESVFYNRDAKSKPLNLFKSIDWIQDHLAKTKGYKGLGHIELGLSLTNKKAIEHVLNDEYLCVSAGAITDSAICSICHTDWASEDKCDHKPGQIVDGRMAFLISGRFKYEELSFVNFGADPFAQVKSYELKDSLEKMFFLGLSIDAQQTAIDKGLKLTDSLYESDIAIRYEDPKMAIDLAAIALALKSTELDAKQAFEIQDQLSAFAPETEEDKAARRSLKSTLTAKIRKNGWTQEDRPIPVITDAVAAEMDGVAKIEDAAAVAAAVLEAETPTPAPNTGIADKIIGDKTQVEVPAVAAVSEVVISDELKALAVELKLTDADAKETSPEAKAILGHYEALDQIHKGAAGDKKGLQYKLEDMHSCLGERWNKDRWVEYAKNSLAEHVKDSLFVPKSDLVEKDEAVLGLTEEVAAAKGTLAVKDKQIAAFFTDSKRSLATTIVMHNCLKRKEGFIGLNKDQVAEKITELSKRHIQSLKDGVNDLFVELQWAAEPVAESKTPATTVNDNAHVDENESTVIKDATTPVLTAENATNLKRMLSYISDPVSRARVEADVRWGRVKL
jgi:hypothetical protein